MNIINIQDVKEIDSCAYLYVDVFNADPWRDNWKYDKAKKRLLDFYNTPGFIGLCVYQESDVIGCLIGNVESYFEGDYFYLKEMFVSSKYQRKGIGKELLESLKDKLVKMNISSMLLFTSKNIFPYNFYINNGFVVIESMEMLNIAL